MRINANSNPIDNPTSDSPELVCKEGMTDIFEVGRVAGQPKVVLQPGKGYEITIRLHTGAMSSTGSEAMEEWKYRAFGNAVVFEVTSKLRSGVLVAMQGVRRTKVLRDATSGKVFYQNVNILTGCDVLDERISLADTMIKELQTYDRFPKR